MKKITLIFILIITTFGFVGCGGSTSTKSNITTKSSNMWKITKDNRYQTYSSIVAAFDVADMFHFEELYKIDRNNSCFNQNKNIINLNNCKVVDYNEVIYFSGSLKDMGSKDENISEYDISNFTIKTEGVGEVKFSSAKIFFNIKYRDSYYKDASLVATDIHGNRVEWDNFTLYRYSDGSEIANGRISSSIINNLWLDVDTPTNFTYGIDYSKGVFLANGADSSSMKLNFKSDGDVEVYINGELIDTLPQDDLNDIYDKREDYLKK